MRRRRPSRCPRRCRSTRRWHWPTRVAGRGPATTTRRCARATTRWSSCCTAAACASASWWRSTPPPRRSRSGWIDRADRSAHVLGKGGKRRSVPVGGAGAAALERWLQLRAAMARGDEPALFVSRRGARLSASQVRARLTQLRARRRLAHARASAHAAPQLCVAPAAIERRPARGAGAARPRQHHDHADLHQARPPASGEGVRRGASARQARRLPAELGDDARP